MSDEHEKDIDESWKDRAKNLGDLNEKGGEAPDLEIKESFKKEEEAPQTPQSGEEKHECGDPSCDHDHSKEQPQVDFINYITSLGFQTLIFMGEVPNPVTNETQKNLDQAKFLIDTLTMLKEKTEGNLNDQEKNLLDASVYELQLKYVEHVKKEKEGDA